MYAHGESAMIADSKSNLDVLSQELLSVGVMSTGLAHEGIAHGGEQEIDTLLHIWLDETSGNDARTVLADMPLPNDDDMVMHSQVVPDEDAYGTEVADKDRLAHIVHVLSTFRSLMSDLLVSRPDLAYAIGAFAVGVVSRTMIDTGIVYSGALQRHENYEEGSSSHGTERVSHDEDALFKAQLVSFMEIFQQLAKHLKMEELLQAPRTPTQTQKDSSTSLQSPSRSRSDHLQRRETSHEQRSNAAKGKAHVVEQPPASIGHRKPSTHGLVNGQDSSEQPRGFVKKGQEDKVCKSNKALYGLKQSPRAWYEKADTHLVEQDDLLITGPNVKHVAEFKADLNATFKMKDLGLLHHYLDVTLYQTAVGCLIYVCNTRPDIQFAVSQLNDWLSLGQHRVWKRMAVSWTRAKLGDHVLDICCGSGDLSFLLAEKVGPTGKVTGLDFAKEQLIVASERQKAKSGACFKDMRWLQGDALNLPFADEVFDAVTVGYGLRNVADIPKALHGIYRVLKRGSSASILDFNRPSSDFTSQLQDWMLDNVVVPAATQFGLREEYAYLKSSIAQFPTGPEQEMLAKEAGFSHAVHYELASGLMGALVLRR
ncbi:hypothetical protein L7F22_015936 [Adiantum nelumboides]|nr:hypothetical protein [Adiantum nelumboides]